MRVLLCALILAVGVCAKADLPLFQAGDALGLKGKYGELVHFKSTPNMDAEIWETIQIVNNNEFLFWGRDPKVVNGHVRVCRKGTNYACADGWVEAQYVVARPIPTRYIAQHYDIFDLKLIVKYWEENPDSQTLDTYSYAHYELADKYRVQEDHKSAIYHATKSIAAIPTQAAYMVRAISKFVLEDYLGCITDCEKGESYNWSNHPLAKYPYTLYMSSNVFKHPTLNFAILKGASYVEVGKYQSALTSLNKGLKELPESGIGYGYRGLAKLKLNLKEDGCADLSRAGELGVDMYEEIKTNCH